MLKFFRRHARGWFMIGVIFIIIIVFVLYFGSNRGGSHANAVAIVDKRVISEGEFHNEYEKLQDMVRLKLGEKLTPEILKKMDLKTKAYDNLLNREIITAKAADLNIQVSDEELRDSIMSMPVLQTNGVFDENKYHQILRYNRMSPEDFEKAQRADLTAAKIESFVREGVKISDKEIYDLYVLQNQQINLSFVRISGSDIKKKVAPAGSELEDYLKRNGSEFRVPEQIKIRYLFFGPDSVAQNISDADIKSYYNSYPEKYRAKDGKPLPLAGVQGSIIKELKNNRGLQTAYLEAKKARDVIYQEDNMEAYGKKNNLKINYSDFFPINQLPKELSGAKNINEELLGLQKNDLSKIIMANNGYYLLQIVEKKSAYVPKLETIENEVRQRFIVSEAKMLAEKEANAILQRLKSGDNMENVARENGLKTNDTGFFQPADTIPKVGQIQGATEILMQLSPGKPYAEKPLVIDNAYFILKLKEASKPGEKDFEAQKAMYRKVFTAMKQEEALKTWLEGNKAAMIKEKRVRIKKKVEDL